MPRKTIAVAEFKANCLAFLENLGKEGLILTWRGRAIAKVTPIARANNNEFIGSMKGKIAVHGDIYSTRIRWDAESGQTLGGRQPKQKSPPKDISG